MELPPWPPGHCGNALGQEGCEGCPNHLQEDEHFIVWMRTAALRNFRKLWGRINQDIPAGSNITVVVQNR